MARPGRVTIDDVAAAAGVSRQTVSRAMNDTTEISEATRHRVLEVARELRYRPSRFGRGLAKPDQRTIGLLVDGFTNPYYPELAAAVVRAASARGWNVVLADAVHSPDGHAALRALVGQVDVVVGYASLADPAIDDALRGVPFVQVDTAPDSTHAGVVLDESGAMDELVAHLLACGTRHPVGMASDPRQGRVRRFTDRMAAAGVRVEPVVADAESTEAARHATAGLLAAGTPVDAVLAFNDLMAAGVLKALAAARVAVPEQVRVVGVDGLSLGTVVTPELTTLAVDMAEVAEAAVEIGVGMVDGALPAAGERVRRRVEHRLVLRASA